MGKLFKVGDNRRYVIVLTGIIIANLVVGCMTTGSSEPAKQPALRETTTSPPMVASTTAAGAGPVLTATPTSTKIVPEENHTNTATSIATSAIITQTTTAVTSSSELIIEYYQSGGFVGLDDHLIINADRQATLTRQGQRYEFELDQTSFTQLLQQLDQAQFSNLENEYRPREVCCDLIEYTVTYQGHTVKTMDTAVPESLAPVLASLGQIIEAHGK